MLQINGRTFMNLQEAVQWLLDNNCIPFQCTADYQANTEIGLGTIVNPTPAKVRIGSLIFFADSKVSTVVGITETGFICSDKYNDLVDDVVYVSNVALDASGHLIVTLSNGDTIDAGIVKQVNNFSINASQHLIANYNDGTSTDLGAIFAGNVNIAGNFTADSIIENMSGYGFTKGVDTSDISYEFVYAGAVKNGNKVTFVLAFAFTPASSGTKYLYSGSFTGIPSNVFDNIYPFDINGVPFCDSKQVLAVNTGSGSDIVSNARMFKNGVGLMATRITVPNVVANEKYYVRYETTFLLSENLAS